MSRLEKKGVSGNRIVNVVYALVGLLLLVVLQLWFGSFLHRTGMVLSYETGTYDGQGVSLSSQNATRTTKEIKIAHHRRPSVHRSRPLVVWLASSPAAEPVGASSHTKTCPLASKSRSEGERRRRMSGKSPSRTASKIRCASCAVRISVHWYHGRQSTSSSPRQ